VEVKEEEMKEKEMKEKEEELVERTNLKEETNHERPVTSVV